METVIWFGAACHVGLARLLAGTERHRQAAPRAAEELEGALSSDMGARLAAGRARPERLDCREAPHRSRTLEPVVAALADRWQRPPSGLAAMVPLVA